MPSQRPFAALTALQALALAACTSPPAPSARPALSQLLHVQGPTLQPALSPDGALLVTSDGSDLWLRTLASDDATNLTADFAPAATDPALSPDGAHIAFSGDGALFISGPRGEEPRRLTASGRAPAFSPDSARLAYTAGGGLWLLELSDGGAPHALLESHEPQTPTFSPDGRHLAFAGQDEAGPGLFALALSGGAPRRLVDDVAHAPAWSPDGATLWYLARRGDVSTLMRIPVEPAESLPLGPPEQVAVLAAGQGEALTIAPRTGRVVLSTVRAEAQIFIAPFDPAALEITGPPEQLTHGLPGARCPQPSPDGHGLAFASPGLHQHLLLAEPDGGRPRTLSRGEAVTLAPHWMPDGAHLIFQGQRHDHDGIWSIALDGGDLMRLSGDEVAAPAWPVVSPDGDRLAFTAEGPETLLVYLDTDWDYQVRAMRGGSGRGWAATSWSPDGQRLALTDREGRLALMATKTLTISPLEATGDWPLWAPDGQHLLVGTGASVQLLDLTTGAARPLLDLSPLRLAEPIPMAMSPRGDRLYLALDLSEADLWLLETAL